MRVLQEAARLGGRAAHRFWSRLREWCGDAAYERYLRANIEEAGAKRVLTRREFYVEQTARRYSQPNRCC